MATVINTATTTTELATLAEDTLIGPDGSILTTSGHGISAASGQYVVYVTVF